MKQSYRHIFLILGTILTVFGLLFFSFQVPLLESDYIAFGVFVLGVYMLYKMLQSAPKTKPKKISIVEQLEERERLKIESEEKEN
jgi:uncharacterized membrane protein